MTLVATVAAIEEDQHVRLNAMGLTTNSDGSVGFGGIVFDDSAGALDIRGWMEVIVRETDCTDAPILFKGWIGDRIYSRTGADTSYKITSARFIDTNLVDQNAILAVRLITNPDGKRPAETHIERIDWLLGSGYLGGLVYDFGLVDRSDPRPFGPADYRDQYPIDVLNDIAAPIFRTSFVYIDQASGNFGLFFDIPTSTVNTSTLQISNVLSDITISSGGVISGNVYPPSQDATLHRDPSSVYAKVRYRFTRGEIIENDDDTYNTYFSAAATGGLNLGYRGIAVSNDRVSSEATARHMADSLLAKYGIEDDTITVTVQLPPEKVGWIDIGQRVGVRFTHLPGYETLTYVRVTSRTIQHSPGTNLLYDVTLELNNTGVVGTGGGGGTGPGDFPHPPSASLSIIQQSVGLSNRTMPSPITDDDVLVIVASKRTSAVVFSPAGYSDSGEGDVTGGVDFAKAGYKVASGDGTLFGGSSLDEIDGWYEISPGATLTDHQSDTGSGYIASTPNVTVPAGGILFAVAGIGQGGGFDAGDYNGPPTRAGTNLAWTNPTGWVIDYNGKVVSGHPSTYVGYYQNATSAAVTVSPSISFYNDGAGPWPWQMIVVVFGPSASTNQPPTPGQEVPWETVTMTTENGVSVGTTLYPYAIGSLQVKVDGVLISPASYTETDPSCGDFALSWQIDSDEVVTVKYIGNPGS